MILATALVAGTGTSWEIIGQLVQLNGELHVLIIVILIVLIMWGIER